MKKVESKSSSYTTGKYLVEKAGMILRNAFGQSEDAAVDFTQFNRIGNYAFEGCKAKSVLAWMKCGLLWFRKLHLSTPDF